MLLLKLAGSFRADAQGYRAPPGSSPPSRTGWLVRGTSRSILLRAPCPTATRGALNMSLVDDDDERWTTNAAASSRRRVDDDGDDPSRAPKCFVDDDQQAAL